VAHTTPTGIRIKMGTKNLNSDIISV
jgi:hypothetical protein